MEHTHLTKIMIGKFAIGQYISLKILLLAEFQQVLRCRINFFDAFFFR